MKYDFLKVAQNRYATKMYDSTRKISDDDIDNIKEILRLSPSSINGQPWKFTIISNKEIKDKLSLASMSNAERVKNCSHLLVLSRIDDLSIYDKHMHKNLDPRVIPYYEQVIKVSDETAKNWYKNQVYLAMGFILAALGTMEIDSTPMEGIEPQKYKEILNLEGYMPVLALALGYRDKNDFNQVSISPKKRLPISEIIEEIK
ncbi:NAD(P)H-dependent oxidoreductase [Mycoplasmopsis anatis]|uniref:Nitroreductase n=2 Tax=Mycoplasmopsis anatis TaxID=171279 RepID=F9QDX0_9BACT|nr:NAD(P)H-dependent oxidoreductase [Mycoplasmopsis anatis]AWX70174.1 NAD(P)H-dependent oxidoreductase [Mycoplasmopsis anatis]EGS29048.1 nitroreductase [Mycoplasmopsis anatis 1340]VEU73383.1 Major NAD(P)H-flavin oxidoreductase [Mycoplasmopsis anatis]